MIKHKLCNNFNAIAENYFIPLAEEIKLHHSHAKNTYFVGVNGSQGSGKSTLAAFLQDYLSQNHAMNIVVISLDDFYLSRKERQIIAADEHPLFTTRGVPGTHNMRQVKSVLHALKNHENTTIPRFNKATDEPHPVSNWTKVSAAVDVVIFEGWCWGVAAQSTEQLQQPVNEFEAFEDNNADWRNHVNLQLSEYYQPLYSVMHKWVMLKAPSFKDVYSWRLEQEQKLIAATAHDEHCGVMNEQQLQHFIQHYQRLTEHALNTLANTCDHVFELNSDRAITRHHGMSVDSNKKQP